MLINYRFPTYDEDLMEDYIDICSKNIMKYNRELLKLYSEINSGETKKCNLNTIVKYGLEEGNYDPLNFTYFIACYFAKQIEERFKIPYKTSLNYTRLFGEGLYYFVHYDEDNTTYDYLMDNIEFKDGYTKKAKELWDIYMRED